MRMCASACVRACRRTCVRASAVVCNICVQNICCEYDNCYYGVWIYRYICGATYFGFGKCKAVLYYITAAELCYWCMACSLSDFILTALFAAVLIAGSSLLLTFVL